MMEQLIMLHLALELKFTATGQLKSETRNNRVASLGHSDCGIASGRRLRRISYQKVLERNATYVVIVRPVVGVDNEQVVCGSLY